MRDHPFAKHGYRWGLVAVLTAALVVAMLAAVPGNSDQAMAAKEPRATFGKVMVPAAAFIPTSDDWDYSSEGYFLKTLSGIGSFTAPLSFPVPVVRIRKITLYALDNTAGGSVCVELYRADPRTAGEGMRAPGAPATALPILRWSASRRSSPAGSTPPSTGRTSGSP